MIGSQRRFRKFCGLLSVAAIAAIMQGRTASADYVYYTWTGPASATDWTTANWSMNGVPDSSWTQSSDSVAVFNSNSILKPDLTIVGGIQINNGATLTINNPGTRFIATSTSTDVATQTELWVDLSTGSTCNVTCSIKNITGLRITGEGTVLLDPYYSNTGNYTQLPSNNFFVGDITVENKATLSVVPGQEAKSFGGTDASGTVIYNDVVLNDGTFAFNRNNADAGGSFYTQTLLSNFRLGALGGTLSVVGTGKTLIISGVIENDGGAVGNLTINGGGIGSAVVLTNENTYTGDTVIQAGTLKLVGDGSIASSENIIVGTGATLDVTVDATTGLYDVFQVAAGQTLSGDGTILGDVTLVTGGILDVDSGLTITGNLDLPSMLTLTGSGPFNEGESLILTSISYGSLSVDGRLVDLNDEGQMLGSISLPGFTGDFYVKNGGIYMDIKETTAVPEPASLMLLGLGAAGLLVRRRR
ncbi:MAG: PEP-CTERM sorting domain-containing protein [Phycisphaerales bacterium]|nr:PEP-CTERM sorting domain-containing protein [Phycisphaerales bacterium]